MNLNKCERCGCFFVSPDLVCPNCQSKDKNDMNTLKTFLSESDTDVSIDDIAYLTGVSIKNVNRFLNNKKTTSELTSLGLILDNNLDINPKINL